MLGDMKEDERGTAKLRCIFNCACQGDGEVKVGLTRCMFWPKWTDLHWAMNNQQATESLSVPCSFSCLGKGEQTLNEMNSQAHGQDKTRGRIGNLRNGVGWARQGACHMRRPIIFERGPGGDGVST